MKMMSPENLVTANMTDIIDTLQNVTASTRAFHLNDTTNYGSLQSDEFTVFYQHKTEQVLLSLYLIVSFLVSHVMQGAIVYLIIRHTVFHTPYHTALTAHMSYGLMSITCSYMPALYQMAFKHKIFEETACRSHRFFKVTFQILHNFSLALIAFERLMFFSRPLLYERTFTVCRVLAIQTTFIIVAMVMVAVTTGMSDIYDWNLFGCLFRGHTKFVLFFIVIVPTAVTISICFVWLQRLIMRHRIEIADIPQHNDGPPASTTIPAVNLVSNIQKSARLILSVSVMYWITYVPVIGVSVWRWQAYSSDEYQTAKILSDKLTTYTSVILYGFDRMFSGVAILFTNRDMRIRFMSLIKLRQTVNNVE